MHAFLEQMKTVCYVGYTLQASLFILVSARPVFQLVLLLLCICILTVGHTHSRQHNSTDTFHVGHLR